MGDDQERGVRSAQAGFLVNAALAITKVVSGVIGNSYALIADGIESTADLLSSTIVWSGLRIASRDPDADYPARRNRSPRPVFRSCSSGRRSGSRFSRFVKS